MNNKTITERGVTMLRLKSVFIVVAFAVLAIPLITGLSCAQDNPSPQAAPEEEIIKKGELLNLTRCMEIAFKRQPNVIAAMNTVSAALSRVGQAQAGYYPQIDLSAGYSRISPVVSSTSRSSAATISNDYDQYTGSATLRQNIYDFGKTPSQVNIQKFNLESSRSDLDNVTSQIIFNVKQSYYGVLQAKRNRDVAVEVVKQFEQHLQQAKGFYEVGTKPKFDVTKAEVDLSNAKLSLIKAENALKIAMVILNNAMGVPSARDYMLEDNLAFIKYEIAYKDALARAFDNRPDIKSIMAKVKASEEAVSLAKTGYYPALTGSAAYNKTGSRFPLDDGWNAGVTLSFPLFSGFLTKNQVDEANANLNVIKANEENLKQSVVLDVEQAFLNLKEAEERIPTAELSVKQATENLEIATGRYAAGVGNPIEVTDAEVAYANAKLAYIQALSDYKVAQASLEKAMGIR